MTDYATNYARKTQEQREREFKPWRAWANDEEERHHEVARLRLIISEAMYRLLRLADENPEVCHAREILEKAMVNGYRGPF